MPGMLGIDKGIDISGEGMGGTPVGEIINSRLQQAMIRFISPVIVLPFKKQRQKK